MRIRHLLLLLATMASLTFHLAAEGAPVVEVRPHRGRPMVFIDNQPQPLPAYSPIRWEKGWPAKSMPRFYPHQMGLYFISPSSMYGTGDFWDGDKIGSERASTPRNLANIDAPALQAMAGDPGAYFIVRFFTHEPANWAKLHPDQLFVTDDGTVQQEPSLASDLFWSAGAELCTTLIRFYEGRPWAHRIIGYANFHRAEGVHGPVIQGWLFDHSPVMKTRWREFLKARYATEERLRAAHNDPALTFENAEVPRDKLRGLHRQAASQLYWQAAKDNQPLRDYLELQRDLFHQRFRQLCDAMRAATPRRVLFLHDALKQTMQGWDIQDFFAPDASKFFGSPDLNAGSGSMAVAPLLELPGCDGLITPHDYQLRGLGGIFEPEGIADSAILRGKLFFCEQDIRTYANPDKPTDMDNHGGVRNLREFEALTWRNLATGLTRGLNVYWMDLYSDWFADPAMHPIIERQVQVIKESVNWPHETVPGIAMVIDDSAVLETNGAGAYLNEAVMNELKVGLSRCGVPYRVYLLDDLALPQFPPHRVFYFPNLFRVDEAKLALLRQRVFRDGNVVVWGPGSGLSDGTSIGTASVQQLTGFACTLIPVNFSHRAMVSNFEHPITRGLRADTIFGGLLPYGPLVFPTDGTQLANAWTKEHLNRAGLTVKEFGKGARGAAGKAPLGASDYAAVFTTAVPLPADLWRNLARYGGAHVYTDSNDILLADRTIVALHSLKSETKTICLPGRFRIVDVVTGKEIARRADSIEFALQAPDTRVFRLEEAVP